VVPELARVVIRIDSSRHDSTLVLRVAGSVAGLDVAVLRDSVAHQGLPEQIDLSGVRFVDAEGAGALLDLEARGVRLVGAEPYVELLLRSRTSSTSS
jgi:anti-anti-sigma regulatory factor